MKKYIVSLLLTIASLASFGQVGSLVQSGYFTRVTDSAAYVTAAATRHAQGYADIWYYVTSQTMYRWDGSAYVEVGSGGGGSGWQTSGATEITADVDIDPTSNGSASVFFGQNFYLDVMGARANSFEFEGTSGGSIGIDGNDLNLGAGTGRMIVEFDTLLINGDAGTAGQVLTSNGPTDPATWETPSSGGTGSQDLFITGPALWAANTSGTASPASYETGTNTFKTIDFADGTDTNAMFQISFPRNWNNGTITITLYWTASAGSGTVQFEVAGRSFANDDALNGAMGTAVVIDDTLLATGDNHITPTSSAMTFANTPADGDLLLLNVMRDVSDDTLNAAAKLLGMRFTITLDAATSE